MRWCVAPFKRPGRIGNPHLLHRPFWNGCWTVRGILCPVRRWVTNFFFFDFIKISTSWISSYWPHLRISLFSSGPLGFINGKARILEGTYSLWEILRTPISPLNIYPRFSDPSWGRRGLPSHCRWFPEIYHPRQVKHSAHFTVTGLWTFYPGLTHWQHPSFFAYFPAACTFEGVLGDLYSSSITNPGFNVGVSLAHGLVPVLTHTAVDKQPCLHGAGSYHDGLGSEIVWIIFCIYTRIWSWWRGRHSGPQIFPGFLFQKPHLIFLPFLRHQTSASDSVLTVVVAARTKYLKDHPDAHLENLVIYTTTQTHSVGSKAALVLGLQIRSIEVRSEDEFSLREDALRNALEDDAKKGRKPFVLSAFFDDQLGPNQLNCIFSSPSRNHRKYIFWSGR